MKTALTFFLYILLLLGAGVLCPAEEIAYFSPASVLLFAQALLHDGDYARAAGEYQRYLILAPGAVDRDAVLLQIGDCYRLGTQPSEALHYYHRYVAEYPNGPLASKAQLLIAAIYFDQNDYHQSLATLTQLQSTDEETRTRQELLCTANYLRLRQWEKAQAQLQDIPAGDTPLLKEAQSLRKLAQEGKRAHGKSPLLAAIMSAVLPGSGKVYAGRAIDGATTLLTLALTGWQAYRGFNDDGSHSVRGWLYGTMFVTFYAGNIYGSAVAVKISNETLAKKMAGKVRLDVTLAW